jgi:hypothetical protein
VHSEELDIDGSETSSQGSIEPYNLEYTDFREGGIKSMTVREEPSRSKAGQNDQEHIVNRIEGHLRNSEDKDHSEVKLEVAFSHPRLHHYDIDCVLEPGNSSSQFWR